MHQRKIWARGLTPEYAGRKITVNGQDYFLKHAEHFDRGSVLTVLTTVEVPHDAEVIVHE